MKVKSLLSWGAAVVLAAAVAAADKPADKSHKLTSISPRKMADALHAVIAADREVYARVVVERLQSEERRIEVSQNWREDRGLPVHAQMLGMASSSIQRQGAEFSYTLRSSWPINRRNGPQTAVEEQGLAAVTQNPAQNFYAEETLGGRSYFTAVYADRAILPSCVSCHNAHADSPKRDFKLQDVMGAIVVRVPLEF